MKTKKLIKANLKTAAFLMFAAAMTNGLTACDSDSEMEDADRPSQEAPAEEPHSNAIGSYDDLAILLNTIAETDETGKVTNRHFGKPLDANDTTHLYIGVNELEEAKDMFQLWLAPDVVMTEHADGSLSALLTDALGKKQGTLRFKPATEEGRVAEVTTDIEHLHFSRITFLYNSAWPVNKRLQATPRYYKFDIVRDVQLKDITKWLKDEDEKLNFVCIQGSTNGVKPMFCAVTRTRYITPLLKQYSNQIRLSRYTPGNVAYPTASNIQKLLAKDWSAFQEAFYEAGCGPLIGGTEYWYDESHTTFIWTYFGVMDYHSGYTYGEDDDEHYYYLLRMWGLDDTQISDGMSF